MNPPSFENAEEDDTYDGSNALDQALADRFAFIIMVPDWNDLSARDQEAVICPAGEAADRRPPQGPVQTGACMEHPAKGVEE